MEITDVVALLESGGTIAGLVIVVAGVLRGWWIPGIHHRKIIEERDARIAELVVEKNEWRNMALRGISAAEGAVNLAYGDSSGKA